MFKVNTAGVDLAKNVVHIGADADDPPTAPAPAEPVSGILRGPPRLPDRHGGLFRGHHWARQLPEMGHEVRLMPPSYVKPYVKRDKTDAADAEAICEAVTRPSMRFRVVKRGGRKEMQLPDSASQTRRTDSALVKALARAFRGRGCWSWVSTPPSPNWPSGRGSRPPT